jgi:atypical dual specificity phosphatase
VAVSILLLLCFFSMAAPAAPESGRLQGDALVAWANANIRASSKVKGGDKMVSLIIPGLYLGNKQAAASRDTLDRLHIRSIVNIGGGAMHFEHQGLFEYYHVKRVSDFDDASLLEHLDDVCDAIDRLLHSGAVLVHCKGGISRSPTVVIAYLVAKRDLPLVEAFRIVQTARQSIRLNVNFKRDLAIFEEQHRGSSSVEQITDRRIRGW